MNPSPKWHFSQLSRLQITGLCALASQAQKIAKLRGDPSAEVDGETWRKNGQDEATETHGLSLRAATQVHYLPIRGFWHVIIGNVQEAFYDFLNSGEQNERMRQLKWRLAGEVSRLADGIKSEKERETPPVIIDDVTSAAEAWNYTRWLPTQPLFERKGLNNLDAEELKLLCDTIFNRASAKLGVGKSANRNKKQRAGRKAPKGAEKASQSPFERPLSAGKGCQLPGAARGLDLPH